MVPHHGLDRPTPAAALATTAHVAAPLPLDVARVPDVGAVAAVTHTTDTGVVMDADLSPVTTDVLADEHISRFLRHARRCAEDSATGLAVDIAPPDTNTGVAIGPAPGVADSVVAAGPTTDGDMGTADGALPYADDFDPIVAGSDRGGVTTVASDGADLEPTSPDLTSTRGGGTAAAMPVGTGRVVDDVSDGGSGTDYFADEVLSDGVADFDPHSAWDDGDEVAAAATAGIPTRQREHMATTRAEDAGGSATAMAWGDDDGVATAKGSDPTSDWDGDDEVTTASGATASTIHGAATIGTARKRKRNRRGGRLHTAKNRRKLSAHNATYGMPAAAAIPIDSEDGVGCHGMTQEPGGGV